MSETLPPWPASHGVFNTPLSGMVATGYQNFTNGVVTEAAVDYIGSISLPDELFDTYDLIPGQVVRVFNRTNADNYEDIIDDLRNGTLSIDYQDIPASAHVILDKLTDLTGDLLDTNNSNREEVLKEFEQELYDSCWMTTYVIKEEEPYQGIRANGGAAWRVQPDDAIDIYTMSYVNQDKATENNVSAIDNKGKPDPDNCYKKISLSYDNDANHVIAEDVINKGLSDIKPKDRYVNMYAGKLHRLSVSNDAPEQETQKLDPDKNILLLDENLANAAGFEDGQKVDFLMVYKNFRESVTVKTCNIKGQASLHGPDADILSKAIDNETLSTLGRDEAIEADPNTVIAIGYKLMPEDKARAYGEYILTDGYPNRAIIGSVSPTDPHHPNPNIHHSSVNDNVINTELSNLRSYLPLQFIEEVGQEPATREVS